MSGGGTCPVCDGRMPPAKRTGRPATFCSTVCRKRADSRRSRAARLLECALAVESNIGRPGFGSEEHLRERAAGLRADAVALLANIGPGAAC
jgi:hypothetical protein